MNIQPDGVKHNSWPTASFFGLFDGHGGEACANYLRDNLHKYITNSYFFPDDPKQAILAGFKECENQYIHSCQLEKELETSGSCAIVILIVEKEAYVANVGDSRAIISIGEGENGFKLTKDHKPDEKEETKRIEAKGGKIYRAKLENGVDS